MHFSVSAFFALGLAALASASGGGFLENGCRNVRLLQDPWGNSNNWQVMAHCDGSAGSNQCSRMWLDNCIGNSNGFMVPQSGGNFGRSCDRCSLHYGENLRCNCRNARGDIHVHEFSLNTFMENDNGVMKCFSNRASHGVDDSGQHACG